MRHKTSTEDFFKKILTSKTVTTGCLVQKNLSPAKLITQKKEHLFMVWR